MLQIGFTNKFYTLWNVDSSIEYLTDSRGEHYPAYRKVNYTYIQNLSFELDKAVEKAQSMGCTDLEPNKDLFGRNSHFSTTTKLFCEIPQKLHFEFMFGKYYGKNILECTDEKYLTWYFNETQNRYAKINLVNNFGYIFENDSLFSAESYKAYKNRKENENKFQEFVQRIKDSSEQAVFVIDFEKNLTSGGDYHHTLSEYNVDKEIRVRFRKVKQMYYNGFSYSLPIIQGDAKKIKGCKMVVLAVLRHDEDNNEYFFEVVEIKHYWDKNKKFFFINENVYH